MAYDGRTTPELFDTLRLHTDPPVAPIIDELETRHIALASAVDEWEAKALMYGAALKEATKTIDWLKDRERHRPLGAAQ